MKHKVGDRVVVRGEIKRIASDGGITVKIMDHTLQKGAEYVGDTVFLWPGAVFVVDKNLLSALRKSLKEILPQ